MRNQAANSWMVMYSVVGGSAGFRAACSGISTLGPFRVP